MPVVRPDAGSIADGFLNSEVLVEPAHFDGSAARLDTVDASPWAADSNTRRYRFAVAQTAEEEDALEFEDLEDLSEPANTPPVDTPPANANEPSRPNKPNQPSESGEVVPLLGDGEQTLAITADRQQFDRQRNVVEAEGDVKIEFSAGLLEADRILVNLTDRVAFAEGNVVLQRGEQILRGDRFEYSFVRDSGRVFVGSGEIFQPTANRDFDLDPDPADPIGTVVPRDALPDEIRGVSANTVFDFGTGRAIPGTSAGPRRDEETGFNRLRFQADTIEVNRDGWQANDVRITNDPFNPPELELRADTVNFRSLDADRDEVALRKSRLVFDENTAVPILRNRFVLDRRSRPAAPFNVGFDSDDRDGLFFDRTFDVFETDRVRLRLTPQFFAQRAFFGRTEENDDGEDLTLGDSFGLIARLDARLDARTAFQARGTLLTLSPDQDEDFRARVRLRRRVLGKRRAHTLDVAYNRQERIFNGSLGFQDVDESFGATISSPRIAFGKTRVSLFYRGDLQRVTAPTDQDDLLDPDQTDNLATLTRFQGVVAANWSRVLWRGKPLPATPDEGLRYTPTPIVPRVTFFLGGSTVFNSYSNGDIQNVASGRIGLQGQFGNFSRRALSFTAFSVVYTNGFLSGESPFLFDRAADTERLLLGFTQQLYGPFRAGVRATVSLTANEIVSTEFILEYSRRTYNIAIRVNPELETGTLQLRINAFNFRGNGGPLERNDIRPVTDGATF